ncbi:MAG: cupin domain-containing protein [Chloroflexi bacterium]|nr:cupin domain-containing protein [Chloroflexota bacterium]
MTTEITETEEKLRAVNTYAEFQKREAIPVLRGFATDDLNAVDLGDWQRVGGRGTYIDLEGTGGTNGAYVCEIAPGKSLEPERHLYEETIYVLSGTGSTSVWYEGREPVSFEWGPGSLFAIPLNAWHRHHNTAGARAARFLAVTSAPLVMNLFHDADFVFSSAAVFPDRFSGQSDYFEAKGTLYNGRVLETNFIPDARSFELYRNAARGTGKGCRFELSYNTTHAHVAEFPVGTYKKAHFHGPGAHVILLQGQGFSLLWPQRGEQQRFDWKAGSMFVPPHGWFHQHFNTGAEPARYLALRWGSAKYDLGGALGWTTGHSYDVPGAQIEYADEDPVIHRMYEAELKTSGATCRMKTVIPACSGVHGEGAIDPRAAA